MDRKDVAIIGIGFRIPSGNLKKSLSKPDEFWKSLIHGFDGTVETSERWSNNYFKSGDIVSNYASLLPLDEWKSFDPLLFGIVPNEVVQIDPQQRLLLKSTWEALEDAGIDPSDVRGTNASVFIGCGGIDYCHANKDVNEIQENIFASTSNTLSNRISHVFDLRGESFTIDSACSSSLNAINLGYLSIKNGRSNLSIVGGCNLILDPHVGKSFSQLNILSPTGKCHSFSAEADGFVRAECVGVVVLKSLDQSIKDGNNIYCVIKGSSSNVDGNQYDKSTFYSPSKSAQFENLKLAFQSTENTVVPSDIDYFECHGTGTPTGDPIELEGISMLYKENINKNETNPILIGSLKSNIGHCESGSGVASLIKCCLIFKNKSFVPNINFKTPNPAIKFKEWNLKVVNEPIKFNENKKTSMVINNFGVTGSNCCLILQEFINNNENNQNDKKEFIEQQQQKTKYLIPFSANSFKSLEQYQSLISNIDTSYINFNDFIKMQIKFKTNNLCQRSVIIASNWDDFKNKENEIKSNNKSKVSNILIQKKNPTTVFVFCGQGSQYNKMCQSLYDNEPYFKKWVDKFDKELFKYYGYSVLQKLRSISDDDFISIHEPVYAQPVNTMMQISLFELYKHWGVKPDIIVGHSLGEVSSPYASGMIDFETLCYLIYHRSIAQNKTTGTGRMLSINISSDDFKSNYLSKYPTLEIGCFNSPTSIVVVGKESILKELMNELKSKEIFCAMLGSLSSFHSSSQLMIKDEILSMDFKSAQPKIPVFSTVTTKLFDSSTPFNSQYVFDNILLPVNFTPTISNLYKYIEESDLGNEIIFIEIAPHPTLQYYLNQMKSYQSDYFNKGEKVTVYSSCNKKKNDYQEFLKIISKLYVNNGYNINFKSQFNNNLDQIKKSFYLPLYQFDDEKYWKETLLNIKIKKDGPSIDHLGNINDNSPFKSYQTFIDIKKQPFSWLKGHSVKGKFYFPGCGFIDNLLKIYPNQDITIDSMEFKTPFLLKDNLNQSLQTNIYTTSKNEYKVKFHFKDLITNKWILAAIGNFSLLSFNGEINKLNIKELKDQCNYTKLSKQEIYEAMKLKTGIVYKGLFQGVKECYIGNNCSFSIISLKEINNQPNEVNNMKSFFLNTPILDSCLHGIIGLIKDYSQLLFDRIEGFKIYSSNIPSKDNNNNSIDEIYVYSYLKPKNSLFSLEGSIQVFLGDGTLLFEIEKVYCTSLTPMIDNSKISSPSTNEIYTPHLQSKNSLLLNPSTFKSIYNLKEYQMNEDQLFYSNFKEIFIHYLFENINKRCESININTINNLSFEEFKKEYNNFKNANSNSNSNLNLSEDFIKFIFDCLKQYKQYLNINEINDYFKTTNVNYSQVLNISSRIMSKQLFPLVNDDPNIDLPQSLFENGLMDSIYNKSELVSLFNKLLSQVVLDSIKPIIYEPIVFRIIEFGGGVGSLSIYILEKIEQLLKDNPSYKIDIEYTFTDVSTSFLADAKEKFSNIKNLNIIYRVIDLDQNLIGSIQDLNPSYYDMVLMSNVLHVVKNINQSLNEIYKILIPNGQLLFIEPPYKSLFYDAIFGVFSQWWAFEDKELRIDRCCMNQEKWFNLLNQCNFKDTIMSKEKENIIYLIQTRKQNHQEIITNLKQLKYLSSFNNIILFINNNEYQNHNNNYKYSNNIINSFKKYSNQLLNIKIIDNFNQFKEFIHLINKNEKSLLIYLNSVDQLNLENYKEITLEYIQINQLILNLKIEENFENVLLTRNSNRDNYLSSSLTGVSRYMVEFPKLKNISIDFDDQSLENNDNLLKLLEWLLNSNNNIQREFIIRENNIYFERYKKESKFNYNFNSKSFEIENNNLMIQLDSNLEYILKPKIQELKDEQVEIEIKSTGINYKDYLIYTGVVVQQPIINDGNGLDNDLDTPNIGFDFSGIVTRCGRNIKKFKIGDQVFGIAPKATGSHVIIDKNYICSKPSNISFGVSASIPSVYITTLHSLYNVGNLQPNETILIHSGTGGVGLSALEFLKYKNHKGFIFLTVGSKEKEEYLRNNYGSFITDIYSSKNKNYVEQIKLKLKQLNNKNNRQYGVDLILNTLSSEFMDSNFKCLNTSGRIVDLSITHLTPNDHLDYKKFKYNNGYHNIELTYLDKKLFKNYLKKISRLFNREEINSIPIIEYSNENIKEAIQFINERKHIGKIIVNHDKSDLIKFNLIKIQNSVMMKPNYDISKLNLGKNILITGQTGIILEILKWLIKYSNDSIENIIIFSKSKLKWELELLINETLNNSINRNIKDFNKIRFYFRSIDISNIEMVNKELNNLEKEFNLKNIDSIIHYAFNFDSCKFENVNMEHLNTSHDAKAIGAFNLHNQSIKRKWEIKQFIIASSGASIVGSNMQCSYVSSCTLVDSFSKYRKSLGLPSLSINYGAVSNVGYVSRNETLETMFQSSNFKFMSPKSVISSLDLFIQNIDQFSNFCLNDFDFENYSLNHHLYSKFDYEINKIYKKKNNNQDSLNNDNIEFKIISKISELLSIEESKINLDFRLVDYGLDSLIIVQLKNWIDKEFSHNLITIQQLQNNKISTSIEIIIKEFKNNNNNSNNNNNNNSNNIDNNNNIKSNNSYNKYHEFIKNEIKLDDSIVFKPYSIKEILNQNLSIFLTGSTGFLGGYILYELLKRNNIKKIYCLSRNKSNLQNPIDEIINNLKKHQLFEKLNQFQLSKIQLVLGNLTDKNFGISKKEYETISKECNILINSGADLNLKIDYKSSKLINVNSVQELIKLSNENNQKLIVQISTLAVFINQQFEKDVEFDESTTLPEFNEKENGYIQSKIISEKALINAAELKGIPSIIIRPPSIFANPETGIGLDNDFVKIMLESCAVIGYYPNIYKNFFYTTITTLSNTSINLILNEESWKQNKDKPVSIYNLNGQPIKSEQFYKVLEKEYSCKEKTFKEWVKLVENSNHKSCVKYNLFHNYENDFFNNNNIENKLSMSNKTKELLKSLQIYNENDWEINDEIIINSLKKNI